MIKLIFLVTILAFCGVSRGQKVISCNVTADKPTECLFSKLEILREEVIFVESNHFTGSTDEDVKTVLFNKKSSIHSIPTDLFDVFQNLENLVFPVKNLQEIYSETFLNARNLKSLQLFGSNLTKLRVNAFLGATYLKQGSTR